MKNKLNEVLFKGSCVLLATTLVGSFCIKGKGASEKAEIEPQKAVSSSLTPTTETTSTKEETSISDKNKNPHLKIGSYVKVYGRGNEASDGTGNLGLSWKGQEMMIVGISENSEYPYACAIVDSTPGAEDVMAWFKIDVIQPLTEDTVNIMEPTAKGAPFGYAYDSSSNIYIRTDRRYVCSEDSKEEIAKQYSISLK